MDLMQLLKKTKMVIHSIALNMMEFLEGLVKVGYDQMRPT